MVNETSSDCRGIECRRGRSPDTGASLVANVEGSIEEYFARGARAKSGTRLRAALQAAPKGFARKARSCFSSVPNRTFCARLLLAPPPRVPKSDHTQDRRQHVANQIQKECRARCSQSQRPRLPRLESGGYLGMRNEISGSPAATPEVDLQSPVTESGKVSKDCLELSYPSHIFQPGAVHA